MSRLAVSGIASTMLALNHACDVTGAFLGGRRCEARNY